MQSSSRSDTDDGAAKCAALIVDPGQLSPDTVRADMTTIFLSMPHPQARRYTSNPTWRPLPKRARTVPLLAAAIVMTAVAGFVAGVVMR